MAATLKSISLSVPATPTYTTFYTCPAATTALVKDLLASNVDGAAPVSLTVRQVRAVGPTTTYRIKAASIGVGGAIEMKGWILSAGDYLEATAGAAGDVDITGGVVELT